MSDPVQDARKLLIDEASRLQKFLTTDRSRRRAGVVRRLHSIRMMLGAGYAYSSQAGQDMVVDNLLKNKRNGTFLDVGGYDGITGSNTFFLEVHRGWTGTLVEPVPAQLKKAQEIRRCPCLGVAVAATDGEADFIEVAQGFTQMSGLADSYDPKLLETVRADKRHKEKTVKVQTRTLSSIMIDAGLENPDFVSLDIEGGELTTLEAFPFDKHSVGFWAIENNTGDKRIKEIMEANGYGLVEFCGPDEIYQRTL